MARQSTNPIAEIFIRMPNTIGLDSLQRTVAPCNLKISYHLGTSSYSRSIRSDFITVKPVLSGHSKRRPKIGFQDPLSFNAGQKYCRMLQESILQYFRPSLVLHLSLFCLFLGGRLRQVLLYCILYVKQNAGSATCFTFAGNFF